MEFIKHPVFKYSTVCTTIETNRFYKDVMQCSPKIEDRVKAMEDIAAVSYTHLDVYKRQPSTDRNLLDFKYEG